MDKVSYLQEKVSSLAERLSELKDHLIDTAAQAAGFTLSDSEKSTLVSLYNKFKNMDLDEEQLREQVHKVYDKLESLGVTKEDVKSIFGKLVDMVKDILN